MTSGSRFPIHTLHLGVLLTVLSGCQSPPQSDPAGPLRRNLAVLAARFPGREVAVAYKDLARGTTAFLNDEVVMHAASTMKVAVLLEVYRQAEAGRFKLDDPLAVRKAFRSIADGSRFELDMASDSETKLYQKVGESLPIRELARLMITRSSNLATNLLVDLVGARNIQETLAGLGIRHMKVLRGVEDLKAYRQGLNNVTCARDLMMLMAAVARGAGVSADSSREMLGILLAQEHNRLIPAGLPPGTRVAHKTGYITRIHHDAAVVFPKDAPSYVLVVLTRGFDPPEQSEAVIAEVARRVHAFHVSRAGDGS